MEKVTKINSYFVRINKKYKFWGCRRNKKCFFFFLDLVENDNLLRRWIFEGKKTSWSLVKIKKTKFQNRFSKLACLCRFVTITLSEPLLGFTIKSCFFMLFGTRLLRRILLRVPQIQNRYGSAVPVRTTSCWRCFLFAGLRPVCFCLWRAPILQLTSCPWTCWR